jgi:hypothetical protein
VRAWLAPALAAGLAVASCHREPDAPAGDTGSGADCGLVVDRIQQAIQAQVNLVGPDAKVMIARTLPAMKAACAADHWPRELTDCVVKTKPGDLDALMKCNALMSKDLQDKLQQRMLKTQPGAHPAQP